MPLKSLIVFSLLLSLHSAQAQPRPAPTAYPLWSDDSQPRLMTGDCRVCPLLPQSKWYFAGEWLAISDEKIQADAIVALPDWLTDAPVIESPPPVWLGKPQVIQNTQLNPATKQLRLPNGQRLDWQLVDKIPQNKSYWNADTTAFFADKTVHMRGETINGKFIAETIWPVAFQIQSQTLQPLTDAETIEDWVHAEQGGASQSHQDRLIWQRTDNAADKAVSKPVLAIMLNGAQGDDHEALAGHFALVTGELSHDGQYHNWLVNNFYSLDVVSEKGIIAGVTPMAKYLADVNSGQNYYRPSYMLVATLNDSAPVNQIQQSMNQIMQHFYRHSFQYQHADMNCTGISIDALKSLGWNVPERGNNGLIMAVSAYFYNLFSEADLVAARQIYDYLMTETSRLLPAAAFATLSNDIIHLAENRSKRTLSEFELQLAENLDALWLVRIPQIPSSRVSGSAPVFSFEEYLDITPAERDDWVTIDLPLQKLPKSLQTTQPNNPSSSLLPWPIVVILSVFTLIIVGLFYHFYCHRKSQQNH
ncbi:MAG: hypothetical protein RQ732_01680 [Methylophaga sp.]|nr:hypothetical protein [Methylophaga sp.]